MLPFEFKLMLNGKAVGYEKHFCNKFIEIWHNKTDDGDFHCIMDNEYWYIRHDEKRQYTGYKDRNGKKIYFGDDLIIPNQNLKNRVELFQGEIKAFHDNSKHFRSVGIPCNLFHRMEVIDEKDEVQK